MTRPLCLCLSLMMMVCLATAVNAADDEDVLPADRRLEPDAVANDYSGQLPRAPAVPAELAIETFRVADGFEVEIVACEPLVSDPVAIAYDEYGSAFVVEMRGYSEDGADQLGVIRLLTDTDQDGDFDQGTDYVKGLSWPTAVACYDGGIFVGAAPDILFCKDTNDDGHADIREVVFTGFGRQNVQGLLNSFIWGLDNKLYGSASSNGGTIRSVQNSAQALVQLRRQDFAIDPRSMTLSAVSGGAQHGMSFDVWGDRYASANSDHLQWIAYHQEDLDRNRWLTPQSTRVSIAADGPAAEVYRASPVEPWRVVRTRLRIKGIVGGPVEGGGRAAGYFTGATGVTIYTGDQWPSDENGSIAVIGDVGGNLIHRKQIIDDGLMKVARRIDPQREFIASTDTWFRPVQYANAPDGTLHVLDMYREIIEHPLSLPPTIKQHLDLTSGRNRGRIYRVRAKGAALAPRLLPGNASDAELVTMLGHRNGWHRETAARLISQRAADRFRPLLHKAVNESLSEHARIRAICCLRSYWSSPDATTQPIPARDVESIVTALQDQHPKVRAAAVIVCKDARLHTLAAVRTILRRLVADPDLGVRYQLALSLGSFEWDASADLLRQLAEQDAMHARMRVAIASSVRDRRRLCASLLAADGFAAIPGSRELLSELVVQIGREKKRDEVASMLDQLRNDTSHVPFRHYLITQMLIATGRRGSSLEQFLANAPTTVGFVKSWTTAALQVVLDETSDPQVRSEALRRLQISDAADIVEALPSLLVGFQVPAIREQAMDIAVRLRDPAVDAILLSLLGELSPRSRRRALEHLISQPATAPIVLDKVEEGVLRPIDVAGHRSQLISHEVADVRRKATLVLGQLDARSSVLQSYEHVLQLVGEKAKGAVVFREVCSSCHQLSRIGKAVGPDLAPLRNRGARFMLTNILDPNRELDPRYEAHTVVLDDGESTTGIVVSETRRVVSLLATEGILTDIPRNEIVHLRASGLSLMPEGLEKVLPPEKMADLIAFLLHSE